MVQGSICLKSGSLYSQADFISGIFYLNLKALLKSKWLKKCLFGVEIHRKCKKKTKILEKKIKYPTIILGSFDSRNSMQILEVYIPLLRWHEIWKHYILQECQCVLCNATFSTPVCKCNSGNDSTERVMLQIAGVEKVPLRQFF